MFRSCNYITDATELIVSEDEIRLRVYYVKSEEVIRAVTNIDGLLQWF